MLGEVIDVFRLRQYFNVLTRARDFAEGIREDARLLDDLRRAVITLPLESDRRDDVAPFPPLATKKVRALDGKRIALMATGGSGAMASLVGAARALEETGRRADVISLCSGSAMFGFPVAAGIPAADVASFTLGLRPQDYIDVGWRRLAALAPTAARGFGGILDGERIEATYRRLVGDMTLAELEIPAYAPVWNIEGNRLEYIGPKTHPDLAVARAVRMAIALPLLVEPVRWGAGSWCDGGIVDIFPVHPVLDLEPPCDLALAINGFYPPDFEGEDASGWQQERLSILAVAGQVRTCQQIELARTNLTRLRERMDVRMIQPVPYHKVRGAGFYRQFLSSRDWPAFMEAGRVHTHQALAGSTIVR